MKEYSKPNLDLKVYRARIYDNGKNGDDRIQVRIIPEMIDYDGAMLDNLPRYPCAFKGKVINGFTEKEPNPDTGLADEVFVLATYDFTVGYILGLANLFYGCSDAPYQDSYGFSYVQNYLTGRGLNMIEYKDIVVDHWSNSNEGGVVILHNHKTGEVYVVNASGTCIVMQYDKIYLRVGSPNGKHGGGKKPFSSITITDNSIDIKAKLVNFDSENIVLGHHGYSVLGTLSTVPVACDGINLQPIDNVTI